MVQRGNKVCADKTKHVQEIPLSKLLSALDSQIQLQFEEMREARKRSNGRIIVLDGTIEQFI